MTARTTFLGGIAAVLSTSGAWAATVPAGATGYALGNNGFTLVTMADLNMPGMAQGRAITTGAGMGVSISSLAFRPATRQMYGYSDLDDTVYLVDTDTAVATKVATAGMAERTSVDTLGFDFNNVLDAARIVTTADENRVFFPNNTPPNIAGEAAGIVRLAYGPGDANEGTDPSVFANAYTNAVPNPATNIQYVLDSQTDSLATLANNSGILGTVGGIFVDGAMLDFTSTGGFDILSLMEGSNQALALLSTGFFTGIYEIDLMADASGRVNGRLIGAAPSDFGALDGFAVTSPAPVPLPAGVVLMGTGVVAFAGFARRRKARAG